MTNRAEVAQAYLERLRRDEGYGEKINDVVYGGACVDFDEVDFLRLALAALEQASLSAEAQDAVYEALLEEGSW